MGKDDWDQEAGALVLTSYSLVQIMGYLELKEILGVLVWLNKKTSAIIKEENYVFFKKLLRTFNIPSTYELSDLPIRENIFEVFKRAVTNIRT